MTKRLYSEINPDSEVFIINDIALLIPPTDITINKEDLVYSWKTLRTSSTTKIPAGHGHLAVHLNIPFKHSQVLEMHRLIIQVKQNPFCFVENKFLRETVVASSDFAKKMAFTVTGLHVQAAQGTSDLWIMTLEMTYFNYEPFSNNFTFRKDWVTEWLENELELSETQKVQLTIGWDIDRQDFKRIPINNIVAVYGDGRSDLYGAPKRSHRKWVSTSEAYQSFQERTIYELEQMHHGEIFDLSPKQHFMLPSQQVLDPRDSLIYKRFYNFLQRDALLKNFGIDLEQLLKIQDPDNYQKHWSMLFGSFVNENDVLDLYSIHSVPKNTSFYKQVWRHVQNTIIQTMNDHDVIKFTYCIYLNVEMPPKWKEHLGKAKIKAMNELKSSYTNVIGQNDDYILHTIERAGDYSNIASFYMELAKSSSQEDQEQAILLKNAIIEGKYTNLIWNELKDIPEVINTSKKEVYGNEKAWRERRRMGWTSSYLKHSPVNLPFGELLSVIKDTPRWRTREELTRIYKRDTAGRPHYGVDIAVPVGTPVYAVESGSVQKVTVGFSNRESRSRWRKLILTVKEKTTTGSSRNVKSDSDFSVIERQLQKLNKGYDRETAPIGTLIKGENGEWYYKEYSDGGKQITLRHDHGMSFYSHLEKIVVNTGDRVKAGDLIGFTGRTGPFKTQSIVQKVIPVKNTNLAYIPLLSDSFFAHGKSGLKEGETHLELADREEDSYSYQNLFQLGAHLHFEYWEKREYGAERDPKYHFNDVPLKESHRYRNYVVVDPTETWKNADPQALLIEEEVPNHYATRDQIVEKNLGESDPNASVSEVQSEDILNFLLQLRADGWFYYEDDPSVTNIWYKPVEMIIYPGNPEKFNIEDQTFISDGLVYTATSGSIRHVVANLPLLGREYPTQQHLGSLEPSYVFEFVSNTDKREGISQKAKELEIMRATLQENARFFRPILDGWSVSTDSFITRLFGTSHINDFIPYKSNDDIESPYDFFELKRRTIILRAESKTIPGQPGLSVHTYEIAENNPYEEEELIAEAPQVGDLEKSKEKILHAVRDLKLKDYDQRAAILYLLALALGKVKDDTFSFRQGEDLIIDSVYALTPKESDPESFSLQKQNRFIIKTNETTSQYIQMLGIQGAELTVKQIRDLGLPAEGPEDDVWYYINTPLGITEDNISDMSRRERLEKKKEGFWISDVDHLVTQKIDLSSFLDDSNGELLAIQEVPWKRLLEYKSMIDAICNTAEMTLSEELNLFVNSERVYGEPLSRSLVESELYNLTVEPSMWRAWQAYLIAAMKRWGKSQIYEYASGPIDPSKVFIQNPNVWFEFTRPLSKDLNSYINKWDISLLRGSLATSKEIMNIIPMSEIGYNFWYMNVFTGDDLVGEAFGTSNLLTQVLSRATPLSSLYLLEGVKSRFADALGSTKYKKRHLDRAISNSQAANFALVNEYLAYLPLTRVAYDESIKGFIDFNIINPILGELKGERNNYVLANQRSILFDHVWTSGHFHAGTSNSSWDFAYTIQGFDKNRINVADAFSLTEKLFEENYSEFQRTFSKDPISHHKNEYQTDGISLPGYAKHEFLPGSPAIANISIEVEKEKLEYYKNLLAKIANQIITDMPVLKALGLVHLGITDYSNKIRGREAYPDLTLPFHPYFGSTYDVSPDFYMWNIYEDADALNHEFKQEIYNSMYDVVERSYNSVKENLIATPGEPLNPNRNQVLTSSQATSVTGRSLTDTRLAPRLELEGTDEGPYGPMASPFYMYNTDNEMEKKFLEELDQETFKQPASVNPGGHTAVYQDYGPGASYYNEILSPEVKDIKAKNPSFESIVLDPFDGHDKGVNYPLRVPSSAYKKLEEEYNKLNSDVANVHAMFGNRAGYLNQKERDDDLQQRTEGTNLHQPVETTHGFSKEHLVDLARASASDIFSEKKRFARAFPTFKLYFIEEDQYETRLLNFDDFYSYNGVTSFSVVQSRKDAADTAIITLQNIAGTLDGTKRNVITDLDYYSRGIENQVESPNTFRADNPVTQDSAQDQPFGAVVLRPGMNVQLRVGYSNEPNNLEVLINGRAVDVQWNKDGDRAEILVQGFGVELKQFVQGHSYLGEVQYHTTHQLLGALMLSSELQHFGRWEFNQMFMHGEGGDARLDFDDYTREGLEGTYPITNAVHNWMMNHPVITGIAVLGIAAAAALPQTRLLGVAGKGAGLTLNASRTTSKFPFIANLIARLRNGSLANNVSKMTVETAKKFKTVPSGETINLATKVSPAEARRILLHLAMKNRLWVNNLVTGKNAAKVSRTIRLKRLKAFKKNADEFLKNTDSVTLGDLSEAILRIEAAALRRGTASTFVVNASAITGFNSSAIREIGLKPAAWVFKNYMNYAVRTAVGISGIAMGLDTLNNFVGRPLWDSTVRRIHQYYQTTMSSLFLSPQDDNLFPPHPKDYMLIQDKTWENYFKQTRGQLFMSLVVRPIAADALDHFFNDEYWAGENILSKRCLPKEYNYTIQKQNIWDIFHEMALRHPGWIYGARPYGKEFRYTMFFGVPSQKYWAQPAPPAFIYRSNQLYDYLSSKRKDTNSPGLSIAEFKNLYPGNVPDTGMTAEEIIETSRFTTSSLNNSFTAFDTEIISEEEEELRETILYKKMNNIAIKEYLRSVEVRFKPFRRYHRITSEEDIVWNGIMSSENATYNAVDVTYWNQDGDNKAATALFKAHDRIPPYQLRIQTLEQYRNCRSYKMAMRYGMGALSFSMREMYRGEIILLGTPRIKPWDICLMIDNYNDMTGPIEVEQVVHTFSHETGYITEIKPSAVVFTNELSSFPVLEALKTATIAISSMQDTHSVLKKKDLGSFGELAGAVLEALAGDDESFTEAMTERASQLEASLGMPDDIFEGETPTGLETIDGLLEQVPNITANLIYYPFTYGGVGLAALGGASVIRKRSLGLLSGATIVGGATVATGGYFGAKAIREIKAPTAAWLLGGSLLLLKCLKGDSLVLVPLIKNGHPVVSGLSYNDPDLIWKSFKGDLARTIDDTLSGTRDLLDLWSMYGFNLWQRIDFDKTWNGEPLDMTGAPQ